MSSEIEESTVEPSQEESESSSSSSSRMEALEKENFLLRRELDESKSEMAVAECVKESMIELERQKSALDEELATMRQLLNEAHDESSISRTSYEHQLAKAKAIISQKDLENQELRVHLKLGHGGGDSAAMIDKDTILGGAAVLSDATKSFARRMKSNLLPPGLGMSPGGASDKGHHQSSSSTSPLHAAASSPALVNPSSGSLSLEDGMKRAYEDTELLKSIVVPLEEQIGALKNKLRETDTLLRQHEERQSQVLVASECMSKWLEGKTLEEARTELLEKSQSEEMTEMKEKFKENVYVSLLCARYSLLSSELSAAKRETAEVADLLNKERLTVRHLKMESVIGNSEMVRSQKEHLAEITRIHSILTEEQKHEIARMMQQSPTQAAAPTSKPISRTNSSVDSSPSRNDSIVSDEDTNSLARFVSNVEWSEMQRELAKVRALMGVTAGDSVIGSEQYRALQAELIEVKKQKAQLVKQVEKFKEEANEEAGHRRQLEEKWNERAEQHRSETDSMAKKSLELEDALGQLRLGYNTIYEATRIDLQTLTKDREKIVRELRRVQDENDVLVGKHSSKAEEMQNEVIDLPEKTEDMHLLLLTFRENLITAKIAKERVEEKLKGEISFLKTQLAGEEQAKKNIEDQFTNEIVQLQQEVHKLESYKRDLMNEQRRRREVEGKEELQKNSAATLQQEIETIKGEKVQLENKIAEAKSKITILQQELDNSVAVQTDFVRLSQSLQMELEKIRQAETEVRWQHEDDIDDCQNCKTSLSVNKRKHHCRHCGRIFCSECVTKKVQSGPRQRQSKVCDVCHTLLVQNSAPYFSTEVPHPR